LQRAGQLVAEWNDVTADDGRILKSIVTSDKKRPADFANDDEPELKRLHMQGNINMVSSIVAVRSDLKWEADCCHP
jgi:hypothetical protein